ncbi:MAG: D-alanyl-D-alanine carboxypeptidase [Thermoanaerobaculia bacterium]
MAAPPRGPSPLRIVACAVALCAATALRSADDGLVWQVEGLDGDLISSRSGNEAVNPASVVKIATALFALTALGPDHRYETAFALEGAVEPDSGVLRGDLAIAGGNDPDFHFENALLVARGGSTSPACTVSGDLALDDRFWIGWEHGSEGRESDPDRRLQEMGERLRRAFDPALWGDLERRNWTAGASATRRFPPPRCAS